MTMMFCSCVDCQKATGTGHSALVLMKAEDITVEGLTKSFAVTANSGHLSVRHFCPECGTPILGEPRRFPGLRLLPAGLFEQNDWFSPRALIFNRSHKDWDLIDGALPRYETYKEA